MAMAAAPLPHSRSRLRVRHFRLRRRRFRQGAAYGGPVAMGTHRPRAARFPPSAAMEGAAAAGEAAGGGALSGAEKEKVRGWAGASGARGGGRGAAVPARCVVSCS